MYNEICGKLIVAGGTLLNMLQKILQIIQRQRMIDIFINHSLCNTTVHIFPLFQSSGFSHMISLF